VSTTAQGEQGHGLGAQSDELTRYANTQGHELVHVITDVVSGTAADKMTGRAIAIAAVEAGIADGLLVRALDRATRDQLDAAELFKRAERNAWRLLDCDRADSGDDSQTVACRYPYRRRRRGAPQDQSANPRRTGASAAPACNSAVQVGYQPRSSCE
jgi:Resolvase, N terminal domain